MNMITFDDYLKVEVRVGEIIEAVRVPKSKKLIKIAVNFGDDDIRQIVTNIGSQFETEQLIGIKTSFITNLEPVVIMGEESKGMLFATTKEDNSVELLRFSDDVLLGNRVG
jgi:methionyl-tRNA synthetase